MRNDHIYRGLYLQHKRRGENENANPRVVLQNTFDIVSIIFHNFIIPTSISISHGTLMNMEMKYLHVNAFSTFVPARLIALRIEPDQLIAWHRNDSIVLRSNNLDTMCMSFLPLTVTRCVEANILDNAERKLSSPRARWNSCSEIRNREQRYAIHVCS